MRGKQNNKVSIKQISEITGFSTATVSNVINGKGKVKPETSEKILKIAYEMQYTVRSSNKRIKMIVYRDSGEVVEDTPFFVQLFSGISDKCGALGYELEIVYLSRHSDDFQNKLKLCLLADVLGIIFVATELTDEDYSLLKTCMVPIVICDSHFYHSDYCSVSINNKDSAQNATNYLIEHGHTRIGYLRGSTRINNFKERADGFRAAMGTHNLPVQEQHVISLLPSMDGAYSDMCRYLKTVKSLPTAFFADNDLIALGAIKALQEYDYRIPEDVSIVGFDDLPYAEMFKTKLTTVRVFKRFLGEKSVELLHEIISDHSTEEKTQISIKIGTQIVERDSVKDLRSI